MADQIKTELYLYIVYHLDYTLFSFVYTQFILIVRLCRKLLVYIQTRTHSRIQPVQFELYINAVLKYEHCPHIYSK